MTQRLITNPILNRPFEEPTRHHRFDDDGITEEVLESRRRSAYFIPIAQPRLKKGDVTQRTFSELTADRVEETKLVNQIRSRLDVWRAGKRPHLTATSRQLLDYWTDPSRENKLFFCQIEALETVMYLTEAAQKCGDTWIENDLAAENAAKNGGLPRLALKMATGTGKTVVMAMLIAWHVLNKQQNAQDARFGDAFLIVTPGITIRDRLRVLFPADADNYYRARDLVPADLVPRLHQAKIVITNFHALMQHERGDAAKLTKELLKDPFAAPTASAFKETPGQVVRRVCRELGTKKNLIVMNDEAHHCYRHKPDDEGGAEELKGDERREAEAREEEARVWLTGLTWVKAKLGLRTVYDLSATPFFLRGSGYPEGTLFPWVVSDFSLIDAIEAGIVKIPRVPVSDDAMDPGGPTYRELWLKIRDELPKRSSTSLVGKDPVLPAPLEGALQSLYGNYKRAFDRWQADQVAQAAGATPPVFIVVCNNTTVSKLVFDWVAGYDRDESVVQAGNLEIFRNDDGRGGWLHRPNTILVDSRQLESGDALSAEFKKIAAREIEDFKSDLRRRHPGRDVEDLDDADILREVMNTVGKRGKLGEQVKCVVSVAMLTEGWDANTVTHVLGVRAFGTQLLCEQVVGRALRRISYATNDQGYFTEEYAEIYGVPFSFIPCAGGQTDDQPGPAPTRVRALPERAACEITFPRVIGYRYDLPDERLEARWTPASGLALDSSVVPTKVDVAPIVGETEIHDLAELRALRPATIDFHLAKHLLEREFADGEGARKPWLFPRLRGLVQEWREQHLSIKGDAFPGMLILARFRDDASRRIREAIVPPDPRKPILRPRFREVDPLLSTSVVDFDTVRVTFATDPGKCHVSHVVCDSTWEAGVAQILEGMDEVVAYVKNARQPGFVIPYTIDGTARSYFPDFVIRIRDAHTDPLNLILEVTGERDRDKEVKSRTARTLWVPAVNSHCAYGRWAFLEIQDPFDTAALLRAHLRELQTA